MPYEVKLQKMNTGHRVVLVDPNNNKLVMAGEIVVRRKDAHDVAIKVREGWNDKRDTIKVESIEVLPKGYKFSKNSGPKKKTGILSQMASAGKAKGRPSRTVAKISKATFAKTANKTTKKKKS